MDMAVKPANINVIQALGKFLGSPKGDASEVKGAIRSVEDGLQKGGDASVTEGLLTKQGRAAFASPDQDSALLDLVKGNVQNRELARAVTDQILMMPGAGSIFPALEKASEAQPSNPSSEDQTVVTHHVAEINGEKIPYTARAGTMILHDKDDKPVAEVFYVSYTKDGSENDPNRPVTFTYNGGPGSSAAMLHLGGVGPVRVESGDGKFPAPPPYKIANNPHSILDKTDLVFIDPVGTGYSRTIGDGDTKDFWGVKQDADAMNHFIQGYLGKYNRWNSPKFLLGESYGTTRSAVVANKLEDDGVQLNGVILVSSILNFGTVEFEKGNDLPYITYLPSYAATAWHHGKISGYKSLPALLKDAENFATGQYAGALLKGDRLEPKEKQAICEKLQSLTGVSKDFWDKANLRVDGDSFQKELLGDQGKELGRLDARYAGYTLEPLSRSCDYAVEMAAVGGPFTAAVNHYLKNDLGYQSQRKYEVLNNEVIEKWDWKRSDDEENDWPTVLNVSDDLAQAIVKNPSLHVQVNNGVFDLGTPYYATQYTFDHLGLPKALQGNVQMKNYNSGHMIYINEPSSKKLHDNMAKFIDAALSKN